MADRRARRSLVTAWLTGGRQLRAVVPSARLSADGTGIEMDIRPGRHAQDLSHVRWWIAEHAPRVFARLGPGYTTEYDQPGRTRSG